MPRIPRVDVGGEVYHVLNRANARVQIFDTEKDYQQFEDILEEAVEKFNMRILAYCIMPNHWHLVLFPRENGDLQSFMSWVTNTHTRRWHVAKETVGQGHLYQGRYKSFLCQKNIHLLTLLQYVESNAKNTKLVTKCENWRWSSIWRRIKGTTKQQKLLSDWPIEEPSEYVKMCNKTISAFEKEKLAYSEEKNIPYGTDTWIHKKIKEYNIEQVLRSVGRPKKGG